MKEKNKKYNFVKMFWVFILGCLIGYVMEVALNIFFTKHFETRQGLIYGPFAPVYGLGTLAFYVFLPKVKGIINIFLISGLLGGTVEYLCSYFQEKWFGTISWDYSNLFLNINGRTSIMYCILWGILGVVFIKFIYPYIEKLLNKFITKPSAKIVTSLTIIFMVFNVSISSMAAQRQFERREHIAPKNNIDVFLDEYYPDEFMDKVFANKIEK